VDDGEATPWDALRETLARLVEETGAEAAAVLDQSNDLWCASPPTNDVALAAERLQERELSGARGASLRKGAHLSMARIEEHGDSYVAESFAGIYVVALWFAGTFDPFTARARLRAALPRIEALTLALPPPDGPAGGEGGAKLRG